MPQFFSSISLLITLHALHFSIHSYRIASLLYFADIRLNIFYLSQRNTTLLVFRIVYECIYIFNYRADILQTKKIRESEIETALNKPKQLVMLLKVFMFKATRAVL